MEPLSARAKDRPAQPTGVVTFLFTDIEGSTARWERDPEAMAEALRRHDDITGDVVTGSGGVVFKSTGDGCCAAFAHPGAAVEASLRLQDRMAAEAWPDSVAPLRVRCAVHTGPADMRDNDYFGPTLNRVARLMGAGHGGQVLMSEATRQLLRNAAIPMRDLGVHRLRDLLEPEHIYQVGESDEAFPPLATLDIRRTNLPMQTTSFIGRRDVLDEVVGLVHSARLVTLTGPGGAGKTRLAVQAAAELADEFDEVHFIDLTHVRESGAIAPAIAEALGTTGRSDDPFALLIDHLTARRCLVILDNTEQIVDAAIPIGRIVDEVATVSVIVTSRELLHLRAERNVPVAPLDVPPPTPIPAGEMLAYASVDLFVQRARAADPSFTIDDSNAGDVATICRLLDGLPLAIELAAAHVRLFPPGEIASMLERDLSVLGHGPVDAPARHRTLTATVTWSYDLLRPPEQALFRRLGAFAGGFSLPALEAVCLDGLDFTPIEAVEALADKSLVFRRQGRSREPRFGMLEPIRSFAADALGASEEAYAVRQRHARYFADLAERAEAELRGSGQTAWVATLDDESSNLSAALTWSFTEGEPDVGFRTVAGLRDFWFYQGRYREMGRWADLAVGRLSDEDAGVRAGVYLTAGFHAYGVYRDDAENLIQRAIDLYGEAGDDVHRALALVWLAGAHELHAVPRAREALHEGLELARRVDALEIVAQALNMWGELERTAGNYESARTIQEEALALSRRTGEQRRVAMVLHNLGIIAHHLGDDTTAEQLLRESLDLSVSIDFDQQTAHALLMIGEQLALRGRAETAAQLVGFADALFLTMGVLAQPADVGDQERARRMVADALDTERYLRLTTQGAALDIDAAVRLARTALDA
jgi:predicted ATPase/class 3 adenylate cyclase